MSTMLHSYAFFFKLHYSSAMFIFILFLSSILTTTTAANSPPYIPTDYLLVNCGYDSTSNSNDGRSWEGDSKFKSLPANAQSVSNESVASGNPSLVERVPYMTARVIQNSPFIYTFPVSAGPKFIRLYFYPATYSGLQTTDSFFSVTAGDFTLLKNFSAVAHLSNTHENYVMKEYIIQVRENQRLNITFSPSPSSYAFINGIEIVSIPADYYVRGLNHPITYAGYPESPLYIEANKTGLEVLYRFNVGGKDINPTDDSGMFRRWIQDDDNVFGGTLGFVPHLDIPIKYTLTTPNYSAPEIVYTTARIMDLNSLRYNMTWTFPVDSGFTYLLRLYFCEFMQEITQPNQRTFTIDINNQTAEENADVIMWTKGNGIPIFKDYVVSMNQESSNQELWLSMRPNMQYGSMYANAILNGLEIFKLSRPDDRSLAGPNPDLPSTAPPAARTTSIKKSRPIFAIIGGITGGITVVSILGFLIFRRRKKSNLDGKSFKSNLDGKSFNNSTYDKITSMSGSTKTNGSSLPSGLCQRFSLAEIKSATNDFDDNFIIGTGGFGKVYKGKVNNGELLVAIKRLTETSNQGVREFETEIGLLSKLRHIHLVSLIGFCDENGEMILVYDYMSNGTLREHLYKTKNTLLTWKQRLQICIGSAHGLHYLHTGSKYKIIHRDVKSTNILLDEKFVAKVSDFGLSKVGPSDMSETHVSTAVKGSIGYLDPEYYKLQQLTEKSDVYSFGVVLFEVLCGRPAIIVGLPKEQISLAEWARQSYRKGNLDNIIDPKLKAEIAPECLIKFAEVAYSCVKDRGSDRPSMNDIVWNLEFALQLQESADKRGQDDKHEIRTGSYESINLNEDANTNEDNHNLFSGSIDQVSKSESSSSGVTSNGSSKFKSESVFSEMMNPTAR